MRRFTGKQGPVVLPTLQPLVLLVLLLTIGVYLPAQDARIEFLDGDVRVESRGDRTAAELGMALRPSDLVITGADGVAIVSLPNGSQIKLREDTVVVLEEISGRESVGLRQGGIFARVGRALTGEQRRFQVTTPTVVAGVRGTEFFVAYGRTVEELPDLWLCVNEGSVEVAVRGQPGATLVAAGQGINVLSGSRATEPRFYAWTRDLNWNFDPEAGEVRDDTDLDGAYSDLLDQDYD